MISCPYPYDCRTAPFLVRWSKELVKDDDVNSLTLSSTESEESPTVGLGGEAEGRCWLVGFTKHDLIGYA